MPKHDFLSPKAVANRMKAKGLQKLRWFCQLCNKQCRDENGFSCHQTSEGHRRKMMVFGSNPGRFVNGFSEMFENHFLEQLKISHRFSRINANEFYQEVIKDKYHIHMNSTRWLTLTDFVKHLGSSRKCNIEETNTGWYIKLMRKENVYLKEKVDENTEKRRIYRLIKQSTQNKIVNETMMYESRDPITSNSLSTYRPHEPLSFKLTTTSNDLKNDKIKESRTIENQGKDNCLQLVINEQKYANHSENKMFKKTNRYVFCKKRNTNFPFYLKVY